MSKFKVGDRVRVSKTYLKNVRDPINSDGTIEAMVGKIGSIVKKTTYYWQVKLDDPLTYEGVKLLDGVWRMTEEEIEHVDAQDAS